MAKIDNDFCLDKQHDCLHNRSETHPIYQKDLLQKKDTPPQRKGIKASSSSSHSSRSNSHSKLDKQIRTLDTKMKNRPRLINLTIIAGIISLFVMSFTLMNFFTVMFASPDTIAKVRYLKLGMSVYGSLCMFLNSTCVLLLCIESKYVLERYLRPPNGTK
jgi:hypothetical protein